MKNDPFVAPRGCYRLKSDWPWEFPQPRPERLPKIGDLVFHRIATGGADKQRIWSELNQGFSRRVDELDLEAHPPLTSADFPALLKFYLQGWAVLPNFEFMDLQQGLDQVACWAGAQGGGISHVIVPSLDRDNRSTWARVFLSYTQGGRLDGTGVLVWYKGYRKSDLSQVAKFALCKHEKRDAAGANHERGWHPGSCTRCGLNMTVDSSD